MKQRDGKGPVERTFWNFGDNDLQEWVSVDDKEPTYQFLTDQDIIQSVREGPEDPIQEPVEEEDDDVVYDLPTTVTQAAKDLENAYVGLSHRTPLQQLR